MSVSLTLLALLSFAGWIGYRKLTALPLTARAYREKAGREADQMRSYSAQSQRAYLDGRRADAKRLSDLSKASRARVEKYNRLANDTAYLFNNPPIAASSWPFSSPKHALDQVDLHELHLSDALVRARKHLARCRRERQSETDFITGWGKGSVDGQAKIKPAVEAWLKGEKGVRIVQQRNRGVVAVEIGHGASCVVM